MGTNGLPDNPFTNADDASRFIALLLHNQARVYAYITVLLPRRSDADDVYQQTCMRLWEKRERFDLAREFLPWAYGFARREVLKHLERCSRSQVQLSSALVAELAEAQQEPDPDFEARREALAGCLEKLSVEHRGLIKRCYLGEETIKAIAGQLRISPGALYMRLSRIRRILLECIASSLATEGY